MAAFVAGVLWESRSNKKLSRAAYFLWWSANFLWLNASGLLAQGVSAVVLRLTNKGVGLEYGLAVLVFVWVLSGIALGVISARRALDGFRNSAWAFLAIVPGLNLVLFLKPSREGGYRGGAKWYFLVGSIFFIIVGLIIQKL